MKLVTVLAPGILVSHFAQAQQGLPMECFRFSDTVGNDSGTSVSNESEVLSSAFREDMRIYEIMGCSGSGNDALLGLTLTLKTTTSTLKYLELESLGYRFGTRCNEVQLTGDAAVSYVEVTFGDKQINSFFAKLGKNKNVLFGARQSGDKTKSWKFDEKNVFIGLKGTENSDGITSIGILTY